jgi:hypothetical protein
MQPFPPRHSPTRSARTGARAHQPLQPTSTMRSTVLLSLLLAPDGGVPVHRHGQGASGTRPR